MKKLKYKLVSISLIVIAVISTFIYSSANEVKDQVILVVGSGGYKATVSLYEKNSSGIWNKTMSMNGFVGKNGITDNKKEGDGKTPSGIYSIGTAFGISNNPGTNLSYRKVTKSDYWVDDINSKYYNQWVDITKVNKDWKSAEHLYSYKTAYKYSLVVNYNTENIVPGKGSAIFLHNSTGSYTGGCISVPESKLVSLLKTLKSTAKIVIAKDANSIPTRIEKGVTTSNLNLRASASTSDKIILNIPKGKTIEIVDKSKSGWYKVKYSGKIGYVSSKYVSISGNNNTNNNTNKPSTTLEKGVTTANLNLRQGTSTSSKVITTIPKGKTIEIVDKSKSGWYKVKYSGKTGYISSKYVRL